MKKCILLGLLGGALLLACNNLFQPMSDDSGLTPAGRLERARVRMNEGDYQGARSDVAGAMSQDSTLSEAYYLRGQIGLREYDVDVDDVNAALQISGDTSLADTAPAPFATLTEARQDSILQGNRLAYKYLAILKSGKTPGQTQDLDTAFQFKSMYLDYTSTCAVIGMLALFDLDTSAHIDSLDSMAMAGFGYVFGADSGLGIRVKDAALYSPDSVVAAAGISLIYLDRARPYADSLVDQYQNNQDSDAYTYRKRLQQTVSAYRGEVAALANPKRKR